MSYKDTSWDSFSTSYLHTFGTAVPVFTPSVFREYRGEIFTTFHSKSHPVTKIIPDAIHNHARFSVSHKDVLRGLHYDHETFKLVQAIVGEIYLVVVDMRPESKNFRKWENYMLSARTRHQVLIPPGFANGHVAVTDCVFHYNLFYPGDYVDERAQGVIAYDDPDFDFEWPITRPRVQKRDRKSKII